jgi:hypothetical protein
MPAVGYMNQSRMQEHHHISDLNTKDGCGNKYYLVRSLQESPAGTCLRFHSPLGAGFRSTTAGYLLNTEMCPKQAIFHSLLCMM